MAKKRLKPAELKEKIIDLLMRYSGEDKISLDWCLMDTGDEDITIRRALGYILEARRHEKLYAARDKVLDYAQANGCLVVNHHLTPCRVQIIAPDGMIFQPYGYHDLQAPDWEDMLEQVNANTVEPCPCNCVHQDGRKRRMKPASELLTIALDLLNTKMAGKVDRSGLPLVLHPLRVMLAGKTDNERIVGALHDLIEDTDVTAEQLLDLGFPQYIVNAVVAVSRREGETYHLFIERIARSGQLAIAVKLNDLEDNMARVHKLPKNEADGLARRYSKAFSRLLAAWYLVTEEEEGVKY